MKKELIILISMFISGIIIYLFKTIENVRQNNTYNKVFERFEYLKDLEREGKIHKKIIYIDRDNATNVSLKNKRQNKRNIVRIDGVEYKDKNTWFIMSGDSLWLVGKKQEFLIEIIGKILD